MKKETEVNRIDKLPLIEKYLFKEFEFTVYCKGDRMAIYRYEDWDGYKNECVLCIELEIVSDNETFFSHHSLNDIITFTNIGYIHYKVKDQITGKEIYDYIYCPKKD